MFIIFKSNFKAVETLMAGKRSMRVIFLKILIEILKYLLLAMKYCRLQKIL